jgi:ABC-type uncharacterized transport system fused permease/ATPase subunit
MTFTNPRALPRELRLSVCNAAPQDENFWNIFLMVVWICSLLILSACWKVVLHELEAVVLFWTGLFVVMSYVQRDFSTALSSKDIPGFYRAIWRFVGIIVVAAPLYAFYHYMQVVFHVLLSLLVSSVSLCLFLHPDVDV